MRGLGWAGLLVATLAVAAVSASLWHIGDALAAARSPDPRPAAFLGPATVEGPILTDSPHDVAVPHAVPPSPEPVPPGTLAHNGNLPHDRFPAADSIRPGEPASFPDEPPPHEGAMIRVPHRIQPSDVLRVELREPPPGSALTGERLVRPDGTIGLDYFGDLDVAGLTLDQVKAKVVLRLRSALPDTSLGLLANDPETGRERVVEPKDSERVLVDIVADNSSFYYVDGDVHSPRRLTFTGHETVLDALNGVGNLRECADRKSIRLVRPGRGGTPAKTYPIDLDAILLHGDPRANLQVLPGDRLIVAHDASLPPHHDVK